MEALSEYRYLLWRLRHLIGMIPDMLEHGPLANDCLKFLEFILAHP